MINVWVSDRRGNWNLSFDIGNLDLSLLIAYKLKINWKARIRLITVIEDPAQEETAREFLANTYPVPAVRIVQHPVYSNGWLNLVMALRDAAIVNNARVAYNAANPSSRVEYAVGLYPSES